MRVSLKKGPETLYEGPAKQAGNRMEFGPYSFVLEEDSVEITSKSEMEVWICLGKSSVAQVKSEYGTMDLPVRLVHYKKEKNSADMQYELDGTRHAFHLAWNEED